jgi:hypothetical protein
MNQAIANIIKEKIQDLDFIDKIAGLVSATYSNVRDGDKIEQKCFPVACCVTADDCKVGAYNDLCPDSKYKTVIYFEDGGVKFVKSEGNFKYYTSDLNLICWINVAKILEDGCNIGTTCTLSAHIIAEIIRHLPEFAQHIDPFSHVKIEVTGQTVRSNSIFSKYTYNEKQTQYLMYPYDYFSLDIKTDFAICMKSTTVYEGC